MTIPLWSLYGDDVNKSDPKLKRIARTKMLQRNTETKRQMPTYQTISVCMYLPL